jgi:hypothetical protein
MRMPWRGLVLAGLLCPVAAGAEAATGNCDAVLGVWEYKAPRRGRAIIAKLGNKYTFVFFQTTGEEPPATTPSTDAEQAAVYETPYGGASEYTCEGTGGKLHWKGRTLYSAKPAEVGETWVLDMELDGDVARWWFLDEKGKRGPMGEARHLR